MRTRASLSAPAQLVERLALRAAKTRGKTRHETLLVLADLLEEQGYKGSIYTGRRGRPVAFDLYTLDVWGNARDGYDINDRFRAGTLRVPTRETLYNVSWYSRAQHLRPEDRLKNLRTVKVSEELDKDYLWRALRRQGFAVGPKGYELTGFGDGNYEIRRRKTGKPVLMLDERDK